MCPAEARRPGSQAPPSTAKWYSKPKVATSHGKCLRCAERFWEGDEITETGPGPKGHGQWGHWQCRSGANPQSAPEKPADNEGDEFESDEDMEEFDGPSDKETAEVPNLPSEEEDEFFE